MIIGSPEEELGGKALSLLTGGKDSATSYTVARAHHDEVIPVYMNFGTNASHRNLQHAVSFVHDQEHDTELEVLDLREMFFGDILNEEYDRGDVLQDALSRDGERDKHLKYIPLRTVGMVSRLGILADRVDAEYLYFSFNAEEPLADLDESNSALAKGEEFINECTPNGLDITFVNPLADKTGGGVIELGIQYGVNYEMTCSCSKPGPGHCRDCLSCQDRIDAFEEAGYKDPAK